MRQGLSQRSWAFVLICSACTGTIGQPWASAGAGGAGGANQPAADGGGATRGGAGGTNASVAALSSSLARRLSRVELDHTFADLLGDTSAPASRLLPEDLFSPYDNDWSGQLASGALVDSLDALATDIAERVVSDQGARARLVPCQPASASDGACFRQVVSGFLPRALRRPVSADEVTGYMPLLALANEPEQKQRPGFDMALQLLIRAVVQDPEFLYRVEAGNAGKSSRELSDYELATRLSYLLWGTTPDEALLADAAAGRLRPSAERKRVFARMWQDARTRRQIERFHAMWLGYRAIPHSAALAAAFARETDALLERVIFDDAHMQSYMSLFTSAETYLDASLAEHYGLPAPTQSPGWVRYPEGSGRAGILSHGSVLSAFGKFSDTSPTQRGIFVRTRLMCQPIPPPPPTVAADKPPAGSQDAVCKADRYSQHRRDAACAGCHALTDAVGFGLENYDNAGRYREHDDGLTQCAISGEGELSGVGSFRGPGQLGALLVEHELVAPCVVQQYVQFALGRKPDAGGDAALLARLEESFRGQSYSFASLVESFVLSDAFAQHSEQP
jgi:hypothetical protein